MTRETTTSILSGAAGIMSVLAILLLLYIVVCNVFFNHDGHTEKLFGKTESKKSGKSLPVTLPIAMGIVMSVINMIAIYTQRAGMYTDTEHMTSGFFSVFSTDANLFSVYNIIMGIVSIGCLVGGSVIFDKTGGQKYSILYCLNIALTLMVMPRIYGVVALLWALGYYAIRKKNYWLLVVSIGLAVTVHFPIRSFRPAELIMLAHLALIPFFAKLEKTKFRILTVVLALLSGFFAIYCQVILR